MSGRDQAITAAGTRAARVWARTRRMSPREQAEQAWTPGGPSVEEIEARIRARREAERVGRDSAA